MVNKSRAGALLAAIATVLGGATAVLADPLPNSFRDPQNNIYITGQSPSARVSLTYRGMMVSRDYQANSCGWVTLRNSTTNPISGILNVGGSNVDTASLPTQLLPTCTNGVAQEARSANFKTSSGDVVIVGRGPNSYVTIGIPRDRTRNATANACGVARFTNSTSYQHSDSTRIMSEGIISERMIENLDSRDSGVLCSKGNLYVPASWLTLGAGAGGS